MAASNHGIGAGPEALILGCVSEKQDHPVPARDLYISPLFVKRRVYAEASGRPWVIYSALYGIVDPDAVIAPYDVSLKSGSAADRRRIGELAAGQLGERFGTLSGKVFEIHAGAAYIEGLGPALSMKTGRESSPGDDVRGQA